MCKHGPSEWPSRTTCAEWCPTEPGLQAGPYVLSEGVFEGCVFAWRLGFGANAADLAIQPALAPVARMERSASGSVRQVDSITAHIGSIELNWAAPDFASLHPGCVWWRATNSVASGLSDRLRQPRRLLKNISLAAVAFDQAETGPSSSDNRGCHGAPCGSADVHRQLKH